MDFVQTDRLWITRDYLWISAYGCGEVTEGADCRQNATPHIWTSIYASSKIWIGYEDAHFCGKDCG
jgi:hypothetical protein